MDSQVLNLLHDIRQACEAKDWEVLKGLDLQMRERIAQLMKEVDSGKQEALAASLRRVQKIYDLVTRDAEKNRAEIATELKQLSKEQKAIASYQNSARI